jgi:hypothetical protein
VILAFGIGSAALTTQAADHLDGPLASADGRLDITDVYAFQHGANTVLIMNVNPAAGVLSPTTFHPDASYDIKIDNNGDAKEDMTYKVTFSAPSNGVQDVQVRRVPSAGDGGAVIGRGRTGSNIALAGGGMLRAGLFDDPFFFDLIAFRGSVLGQGTRRFCDTGTSDFFKGLNVSSIVLEVPSASLVGATPNIGVWARTELNGQQMDRMGRPAINTVFQHTGAEKDAYNRGIPKNDRRDFTANVYGFLAQFYPPATATAITNVLLPDILTFDTSSSAGFLNGRKLSDDVIDAELGLVTNGAITTDCVGNDSTFSAAFPYLGTAN